MTRDKRAVLVVVVLAVLVVGAIWFDGVAQQVTDHQAARLSALCRVERSDGAVMWERGCADVDGQLVCVGGVVYARHAWDRVACETEGGE